MWLLLRAVLARWILGKLALRGLASVILLAPIASVLKLAGLPLLDAEGRPLAEETGVPRSRELALAIQPFAPAALIMLYSPLTW